MKIIADENIAKIEVFQSLGELHTLPGREINAEQVKDADALLVRSITKVNKELLETSSLKFVASATSGIDHIDTEYLKERNISFHYAPGCNARSVVEYVFSALAFLSQKRPFDWRACSFGIVGAGNIGGMLARYLDALGIEYLIYDPYLGQDSEHKAKLCSFDEVLQQDVLSIHTPLTVDDEFPSYHLFNEAVIKALSPGKILINAARGGVFDNQALLTRLLVKNDLYCILDAWENEPAVDLKLMEQVVLGTPHIAGYSLDGKLKGTEMIYKSLCQHFSLTQDVAIERALLTNTNADKKQAQRASHSSKLEALNNTLLSAYDIKQDHINMQALLSAKEPALLFDQLRKTYPVRLEYSLGENLPVY